MFDWDEEKRNANIRKHGIDFIAAKQVFDDLFGVDDEERSMDYGEMRRKVIGHSAGELLSVVYTLRGDIIRIVSARRASKSERRIYEDSI
ncbi:BrnT family toxin [Rhizobium sp. TH2]|uniref:BrnT family toxin n=1 Tax=Rhizobium sp. TH2 TaxID=2775403 RepID=UPI00215879D7|nr:BrnT family toxin [Rhizobium sp. TH2]UVC08508.1 BrnT family toxin [Rhizobium sp. TH2]